MNVYKHLILQNEYTLHINEKIQKGRRLRAQGECKALNTKAWLSKKQHRNAKKTRPECKNLKAGIFLNKV